MIGSSSLNSIRCQSRFPALLVGWGSLLLSFPKQPEVDCPGTRRLGGPSLLDSQLLFLALQVKAGFMLNILGVLTIMLAINTWGIPMFNLHQFPAWAHVNATQC